VDYHEDYNNYLHKQQLETKGIENINLLPIVHSPKSKHKSINKYVHMV
jgi:hypothetical protein